MSRSFIDLMSLENILGLLELLYLAHSLNVRFSSPQYVEPSGGAGGGADITRIQIWIDENSNLSGPHEAHANNR